MINLTIGTNTTRRTIIVPKNSTIDQIVADNQISIANCTLTLNGSPLMDQETSKTLEELGATEESMLIAVVKSKAGR